MITLECCKAILNSIYAECAEAPITQSQYKDDYYSAWILLIKIIKFVSTAAVCVYVCCERFPNYGINLIWFYYTLIAAYSCRRIQKWMIRLNLRYRSVVVFYFLQSSVAIVLITQSYSFISINLLRIWSFAVAISGSFNAHSPQCFGARFF